MKKLLYSLLLFILLNINSYGESLSRSDFNSLRGGPVIGVHEEQKKIQTEEIVQPKSIDTFSEVNRLQVVQTPVRSTVKTKSVAEKYISYSTAYWAALAKHVDLVVYNGYNVEEAERASAAAISQGKIFCVDTENLLKQGVTYIYFVDGKLFVDNGGDALAYKQSFGQQMYGAPYSYSGQSPIYQPSYTNYGGGFYGNFGSYGVGFNSFGSYSSGGSCSGGG